MEKTGAAGAAGVRVREACTCPVWRLHSGKSSVYVAAPLVVAGCECGWVG